MTLNTTEEQKKQIEPINWRKKTRKSNSKFYNKGDTHVKELWTRVGQAWRGIHARCYNPNNRSYKDYGGRGIAISDEFKDFAKFKEYLKELPRYDEYLKGNELSLDRIDNDKNYERGNLRFVDQAVQSANSRNRPNKNGFRGVCLHKKTNKYNARISVNKKKISLGYYKTGFEAALAYNQYVIKNNLPHLLNKIPTEALKPIAND